MLLYHRPVPAKIPKRRSRAGCIHCKEKKKKCNEERPQCDRCMERGLRCQYEPVKPRKRRRTTTAADEAARPRSVTSDPGPPSSYPAFAPGLPPGVRSVLCDARAHSASPSPYIDVWDDDGADGSSAGPFMPVTGPGAAFRSPMSTVHDLGIDSVDSLPGLTDYDGGPGCGTPAMSAPCTVADFPLSSCAVSPVIATFPQSPPPTDFAPPSYPRTVTATGAATVPDLRLGTPVSSGSPVTIPKSPFLEVPSSHADDATRPNRRLLLEHFATVFSPLLVFTERPMNPLRQHILPMASRSPVVMSAVLALAAAHMENLGLKNEERSLDFHSHALQGLAQLLSDPRTSRDDVLAAIVLLMYYEVVRNGSSSVLSSHLRGGLSVMRARPAKPGPTSYYLEKAFCFFDVLCALSFGSTPVSGSVMPTPTQTPESYATRDMFGMSTVDNVFGFAGDLWPLLHRLSHLQELRRSLNGTVALASEEATVKRAEFESLASNMELALHQWVPKVSAALVAIDPSIEDAHTQAALSQAEACREAALVFLARTVQQQARSSPQVQAPAKHGLQACLRVVVFGGPMVALLWPLFHAACEVVDDVDRGVARTVFRHLESRQGMQNVVQAWEVVEEVWHRQDDGDAADWVTVCYDMNRTPILA